MRKLPRGMLTMTSPPLIRKSASSLVVRCENVEPESASLDDFLSSCSVNLFLW